jgi:hypothetical protein
MTEKIIFYVKLWLPISKSYNIYAGRSLVTSSIKEFV